MSHVYSFYVIKKLIDLLFISFCVYRLKLAQSVAQLIGRKRINNFFHGKLY